MSQVLIIDGGFGADLRSVCRDQDLASLETAHGTTAFGCAEGDVGAGGPVGFMYSRYLSGPGDFIAGSWVNYAQQEPKKLMRMGEDEADEYGIVDLVVAKPCESRFGAPA